ncbi:adhesion G protein-coupled receptor F5-like [Protopterus annectens]|uniref:adhesion G protein-coupled receptor F5-like n=1 Tax=Protopterus annectens TaxID=7888 RepID=UPI001CFBBB56|nr:adhesion G protein-coupled receptor F5-like [Protopterus annectens]
MMPAIRTKRPKKDEKTTGSPQRRNNFMSLASAILGNTMIWRNISNKSSDLLRAVEKFTKLLLTDNTTIEIENDNIKLKGSNVSRTSNEDFNKTFNNNGVFIPMDQLKHLSDNSLILYILYPTLHEILPKNVNVNATSLSINGIVMSVTVSGTINNVTLTFEKTNTSLTANQCVFWNFSTISWESTCTLMQTDTSITCNCNHLTPFSVLMSSDSENTSNRNPPLETIQYIGMGISMASVTLLLIVEGIVWKSVVKSKTSYAQHVSVVNIAISLLIADTCFIIDDASVQNENSIQAACTTLTFFTHYFYLCLFFWMFVLGLFLFYRLVFIFHYMSRSSMVAIAISLGYGCPLLIACVTVAVTEPAKTYTMKNICWLNEDKSKALLAFVIPALTIVCFNVIPLIVVTIRAVQRFKASKHGSEEKNRLCHIAKMILTLTPLLGVTWALGFLTFYFKSYTIKIIFTVLNSFQLCSSAEKERVTLASLCSDIVNAY